jgi:hypothetical protein
MSRRQIEAEMSPISDIMVLNECVVSIALFEEERGFNAEFWVSRLTDSEQISMVARFEVVLAVSNSRVAKVRSKEMVSGILDLVQSTPLGDEARLTSGPDSSTAGYIFAAHAQAHLETDSFTFFEMMTATRRTWVLYDFAKSVGISTPAVAVAQIENVEPKTIHDRIRAATKTLQAANHNN